MKYIFLIFLTFLLLTGCHQQYHCEMRDYVSVVVMTSWKDFNDTATIISRIEKGTTSVVDSTLAKLSFVTTPGAPYRAFVSYKFLKDWDYQIKFIPSGKVKNLTGIYFDRVKYTSTQETPKCYCGWGVTINNDRVDKPMHCDDIGDYTYSTLVEFRQP